MGNASYYFSDFPHCWGWANMKRAWQHYDHKLNNWSVVEKFIVSKSRFRQSEYFEAPQEKENKDIGFMGFSVTFSLWVKHACTTPKTTWFKILVVQGQELTLNRSMHHQLFLYLFPTHPSSIFRNTAAGQYFDNHFKVSTQIKSNRFTQADYERSEKKKRYTFLHQVFCKKIKAVGIRLRLHKTKKLGDEIPRFTLQQ